MTKSISLCLSYIVTHYQLKNGSVLSQQWSMVHMCLRYIQNRLEKGPKMMPWMSENFVDALDNYSIYSFPSSSLKAFFYIFWMSIFLTDKFLTDWVNFFLICSFWTSESSLDVMVRSSDNSIFAVYFYTFYLTYAGSFSSSLIFNSSSSIIFMTSFAFLTASGSASKI